MKPNFALSLSFEGVRLLHRAADGWRPVGAVSAEASDFAGELAALRAAALGLEPGGMRATILVIPEWIKTVSIDDPDATDAQVRAAVDGITSAPIDSLVIDRMQAGGRTHVATVTRQHLAEAEAFATEHRLSPVAFAARLPEGAFPGEAFFGETRLARTILGPGEQVEREEAPAAIMGALAAVAAAAAEAEASATPERPSEPPEIEGEAAVTRTAEPAEPIGAAADGPSQDAEAVSEPLAPAVAEGVPEAGAKEAPDPDPSPEPPSPAHDVPKPIFASRTRPMRGGRTGQGLAGAAAAGSWALNLPAPADAEAPSTPAALPEPRAGIAPPEPSVDVRGRATAAERPAPRAEAARMTVFGARQRVEAAAPRGRPRFVGLILTAVLLVTMAAVGVWAAVSDAGLGDLWPRGTPRVTTAAAPLPDPPVPEPVAAQPPVGGTIPEAAGTAAEAAVAAAMVGLAEAEPPVVPAVEPDAEPAPPGPAVAATPGNPVDAAEAERVYAATGVWLRAPRLPVRPEVETLEPPVAGVAEQTPRGAPVVLAQAAPDAAPAPQRDPPPPGAVYARDDRGLILATPEGVVTPEGILVVAGPPGLSPPTRPGSTAADLAGPAAGDEPVAAETPFANAMPASPPSRPEARPEGLAPPEAIAAGPGTPAVPEGEPGALAFAADGTTPGGVALDGLSGEEGLPEAGAAPEVAAFAGPRPTLRPEGLAPPEAVAAATADPSVDEALAAALEAGAPVPDAAPEGADPAAATPTPPAAPDLASTLASIVEGAPDPLAGATAQAVPAARRPDTRPRNFDRVVSDQLGRLARAAQPQAPAGGIAQADEQAETDAEVASDAAAAPTGPTAASVAQAATFADVMALREMNLIGVYGQPGARRALVRTGNGQLLRVGIGDGLDGGQVTAIGDNAINYVRRGQTLMLAIPGE